MTDELIIRNTFINSFCTCPKKYYWQCVRRLIPVKKPLALDMGGLLHEGLKVFHHPLNKGKSAQTRLEAALNQITTKINEADVHEDEFDPEEAYRIMRGYAAEYPEGRENILSVEQKVNFYLEDNILYQGTIDGLGRDGELIMWEHKSCRSLSDGLVLHYSHSPQTIGYAYCLQRMLSERVKYIVLNFLVKTKKPAFHREKVMVHERYLENWREWITTQAHRLIAAYDTNFWFENRYSCYPWVGKPCIYVPLCWYGESPQTLSYFKIDEGDGASDALSGEDR